MTKKKIVSRERAKRYIKFYKKEYNIAEDIQPTFWQAVLKRCENPDIDINLLGVSDEYPKCIRYPKSMFKKKLFNVEKEYGCTVTELVILISEEIIKRENTPIDPLELLEFEKRIERIEEKMI